MGLRGLDEPIRGERLVGPESVMQELDFPGASGWQGVSLDPCDKPTKYCPHFTGKGTAIQRGNPGLCDCGGTLSLPGFSGQRSEVSSQSPHVLGPLGQVSGLSGHQFSHL